MSMAAEQDTSAAAAPAQGGTLEISVCDPVKQSDGSMSAYICYKVNTRTTLPAFEFPQASVIRRYSDFVWLQGKLAKEFPGAILPPLPEKVIVGRFSPEVVEARRRSLERYLNRCGQHPELVTSQFFRIFLEGNDEALSRAKAEPTQSTAQAPARGGRKARGFMQWVDDAVSSVSQMVGGAAELPKTPEDIAFEEVSSYVAALEPQLQSVYNHTQGLNRRSREHGNALFEVGLAFTLLGQAEGDALGTALTQLGHTADGLSVLQAEQVEKDARSFEASLLEYNLIVQNVKAAMAARTSARNAYRAALGDLEAKQAAHAKLLGTAGREDKVAAAEQAKIAAQTAVDEAQRQFERVGERVLAEVDRFKAQKLVDFKAFILDYVNSQVEYAAQVERSWAELLPALEGIPAAAPASGAPASGGAAGGAAAGAGAAGAVAPPAAPVEAEPVFAVAEDEPEPYQDPVFAAAGVDAGADAPPAGAGAAAGGDAASSVVL